MIFELDELDEEPPEEELEEEEPVLEEELDAVDDELDEVELLEEDELLVELDDELLEDEVDELELEGAPPAELAALEEPDASVGASGLSAPQAARRPPAASAAPLDSSFRNSRRRVCSGRS